MVTQVPVTLYSVRQATVRLRELKDWDYSPQGLRDRMRAEGLPIYRIGNVDFITERDLLQLSQLPKPKRGPR